MLVWISFTLVSGFYKGSAVCGFCVTFSGFKGLCPESPKPTVIEESTHR